jgi:hypothetical protein
VVEDDVIKNLPKPESGRFWSLVLQEPHMIIDGCGRVLEWGQVRRCTFILKDHEEFLSTL